MNGISRAVPDSLYPKYLERQTEEVKYKMNIQSLSQSFCCQLSQQEFETPMGQTQISIISCLCQEQIGYYYFRDRDGEEGGTQREVGKRAGGAGRGMSLQG